MRIMNVVVFYVLILCIIETSSKFNERSALAHILHKLNKLKCDIHDLIVRRVGKNSRKFYEIYYRIHIKMK